MEHLPSHGPGSGTSSVYQIDADTVNFIENQFNQCQAEQLGTSFLRADAVDGKKVSFISDESPTISDDADLSHFSDPGDDLLEPGQTPGNNQTNLEKVDKTIIKEAPFLKKLFSRRPPKEKKQVNRIQEHYPKFYDLYVQQSSELEEANSDNAYLKDALAKEEEKNKHLQTEVDKLKRTNAVLVSENVRSLQKKEEISRDTETMTSDVSERVIQALPSDFIRMFTFEKMRHAVDQMKYWRIKKGQRLFKQGGPGNALYVIETGCYEFLKNRKGICDDATFLPKPNAGKWDVLGADEFFYNSRHVQTCVCKYPGKVWCLKRSEFQKAAGNIAPVRLLAIFDCLSQVFPSYSQKQRQHLTKKCEMLLLSAGDFLVRSGDTMRHIYVVKHGQLTTLNHGRTRGKMLSVGDVISQPYDLRVTHSYVAYGMETVQCIAIPVTKFSPTQLKKINSSDQDATRENVLRNFEAHLIMNENPDEDKSGTSGYVSQSSISTNTTGM